MKAQVSLDRLCLANKGPKKELLTELNHHVVRVWHNWPYVHGFLPAPQCKLVCGRVLLGELTPWTKDAAFHLCYCSKLYWVPTQSGIGGVEKTTEKGATIQIWFTTGKVFKDLGSDTRLQSIQL